MLAVIQHKQQLRGPQPVGQRLGCWHLTRLPDAERLHDLRRNQPRAGDPGQIGKPHAVSKTAGQLCRDLDRQSRLADPASPGQRDYARRAEQQTQLGHLVLATQEAGQRRR